MTIKQAQKETNMTFKEARDKAVEAGFDYKIEPQDTFSAYQAKCLLNPKFFQSLGKAMGHEKELFCYDCGERIKPPMMIGDSVQVGTGQCDCSRQFENNEEWWLYHWHRFLDYLASGKSVEDFFKELN